MTMAKKKEIEVIQANTDIREDLEIISAIKVEADKIGNNCLQIVISDEATLSVAQQNLSSAAQLVKSIEEMRKLIKQPYLDAGKLIDETCGQITELAEKGITHLKTQIKMWEIKRVEDAKKAAEELAKKQAEEAAKLEEETKRKKEQTDFYNKVAASLQQMYSVCTTIDKCDEQIKYIGDNFPPAEKFGEYADQAMAQATGIIKLIEAKKEQLERADTLSDAEKEIIKAKEELLAEKNRIAQKEAELKAKEDELKAEAERKKKEAEAEAERVRLEAEQQANKTRGVKYLWKFELVDKTKLSADWMAMDEAAVKEFLKANKDTLKDGDIISGVRFYKDQSVGA